jgi:hypothetical protein
MDKGKKQDILYISSVPVTLLYSGATFMYRLFQGYEQRLLIVQDKKLQEASQLDAAPYFYINPLAGKLINTRFRYVYNLLNVFKNDFFIPATVKKIMKEKSPKLIVTVSNGLMWILAYQVARKYKIPLVIIAHDDLHCYFSEKKTSGRLINNLFAKAYRHAANRFCISELMKDTYLSKFNSPAEVLYPLQGNKLAPLPESKREGGLRIAYAGSLDVKVYVDMIIMLADELRKVNGKLVLFATEFPQKLAACDNIVNYGFLHPDELQRKMQETADAFFVPFIFETGDTNVELAFPSKMADYTLIPKPLLIWAPAGCALSLWFSSLNERAGVLVTEFDKQKITEAIRDLSDPGNNERWGKNSYNAGAYYFDGKKQQAFFFKKLDELITGAVN